MPRSILLYDNIGHSSPLTCFLYSAVGYQGSSHPPTRWLNQSSRSSNQRSTSSSTISGFSPRRTNSCLLLSLSVSNNRLKFATTGYGTLRVSRYVALHGFFLLGSKCRTRVSYPPLLSPQELSWRAHSLTAVRTATGYRASPLVDLEDPTILHTHEAPVTCRSSSLPPPYRRLPISIRNQPTPSTSHLAWMSQYAESRNTHLNVTHPDDYLDGSYRLRRFYLVNAFRKRMARQTKVVYWHEEDENELPPAESFLVWDT